MLKWNSRKCDFNNEYTGFLYIIIKKGFVHVNVLSLNNTIVLFQGWSHINENYLSTFYSLLTFVFC